MGAPKSSLFIGPNWNRQELVVLRKRTNEVFSELAVAHVDGSIGRVLLKCIPIIGVQARLLEANWSP